MDESEIWLGKEIIAEGIVMGGTAFVNVRSLKNGGGSSERYLFSKEPVFCEIMPSLIDIRVGNCAYTYSVVGRGQSLAC